MVDSAFAWLLLLTPIALIVGVIGYVAIEEGLRTTVLGLFAVAAVVAAAIVYAAGMSALGFSASTTGGILAFGLLVGGYAIWRIAGGRG